MHTIRRGPNIMKLIYLITTGGTRILGTGPFRPHDARSTNVLLLSSQQVNIQDSVNGKNRGAGTYKSNAPYVPRGGWKAERIAVSVSAR
jgi:hypothetical protein